MWSIDRPLFQWPWTARNPQFTPICDADYIIDGTIQLSRTTMYCITSKTLRGSYSLVYCFQTTSKDLYWLTWLRPTVMGGSRILVWEGPWQEVWGTSPRLQGQSPGEGLGQSPQEPGECCVMGLKKNHLRREKRAYMQTDIVWQYHNIIISIHSPFCFQPFLS